MANINGFTPEMSKIIDKWHSEYCKEYGKYPTWEMLNDKVKEVREQLKGENKNG